MLNTEHCSQSALPAIVTSLLLCSVLCRASGKGWTSRVFQASHAKSVILDTADAALAAETLCSENKTRV